MIDLAPEQLAIVRSLLAAQVPECEVRAFGSRVTGNAKPYSDLDIVLLGPARLPIVRLAALRETFAESELPIRVDAIDWHAISENFRNIITTKFEILRNPAPPAAESAKLEHLSTVALAKVEAVKANLRGLDYGG